MEYRQLGESGLKVSSIGLGTNNFGPMNARVDAGGAAEIIDSALDAGITMIDTANMYGGGLSEEFIGRALKGKRHKAVVATKVAGFVAEGPNGGGLSRQHIITEVENSLRRLGTDYIDLYQTHFTDPNTPIEETLRALDDLVRQGKVRYIGCSNQMAWQVCEAIYTSRSLGITEFISVQPRYNMLDRGIEGELAVFSLQYGVGILPYYPLANGFLTGKYKRSQPPSEGTRLAQGDRGMLTSVNFDMLDRLEQFATQREHSILELAFAWLLATPWVSSVIAGASNPQQVVQNAAASDWHLSDEDMIELDTVLGRTPPSILNASPIRY